MTYLALRCSRYINGVAMHHGEVSHGMFPELSHSCHNEWSTRRYMDELSFSGVI